MCIRDSEDPHNQGAGRAVVPVVGSQLDDHPVDGTRGVGLSVTEAVTGDPVPTAPARLSHRPGTDSPSGAATLPWKTWIGGRKGRQVRSGSEQGRSQAPTPLGGARVVRTLHLEEVYKALSGLVVVLHGRKQLAEGRLDVLHWLCL